MLQTPALPTDPGRRELLSVAAVPGPRPGSVVVGVTGEVDAYTAPALEVCLLSQARQRGLRLLVVDLSGVTFLGAAGATVLARAHRRCLLRGAELVLRTGGRRRVLRLLQLTGLAGLVATDVPESGPQDGQPRTAARPQPPVLAGADPALPPGVPLSSTTRRGPSHRRPVLPATPDGRQTPRSHGGRHGPHRSAGAW